ncbi:possible inhibitor/regulator of recA, recX [Psychrobacter arcticus 273-4]|uniref:Regulatory protein RecX n=1 Tax=Psychrobacter arcticus (strain DSM 17307 / VKM B-2377 / 273-4) TaxID=259536 RepID=Q4FQX7_PSYA2|nr:regulatory protein RecX [Psychrobacter arcticus]AAZ19581.1 possible inhibitor/regulator of recA, recX [Psychrobacter arcticus 273-4]
MKIKTLAEILAESDTDSASHTHRNQKTIAQHSHTKQSYKDKPKNTSKTGKRSQNLNKHDLDENLLVDNYTTFTADSTNAPFSALNPLPKSKKRKKRFHPAATFHAEPNSAPAYQPPAAQSIKEMLAEVKHAVHDNEKDSVSINETGVDSCLINSEAFESVAAHDSEADNQNSQIDNLPAALKAYLRTPEQRQAEVDAIKAESRLRWLAFYYLSRREYGKAELKQKLLDKEQEAEKIDALLDEFEEKGYQSDYRTTLMLIRENIRKGRGKGRIKQEFYRKKMSTPDNIDELIDMANAESDEFSEFIDDSADNLVEGIDWLKLAVSARTRKYGDSVPVEQKDKARQLRFLQYRGFNIDICFAALNYTLDTLDERF